MASNRTIAITVIIVIKASPPTLSRALQSLNSQDDCDFHVLVKDFSQSESNRQAVLSSLPNLPSSNVRYIALNDSGIYDALNQAIGYIHNGYVAILHSDDSYPPDAISNMKLSIKHSAADIIYGINRHVTRDQAEYCLVRHHHNCLTKANMLSIEHTAAIIRRSCFTSLGMYLTHYTIASDYEFFLRASLSGHTFYSSDFIFCNHTQGGLSQSRMHLARSEMLKIKLANKIISFHKFLFLLAFSYTDNFARLLLRFASATRRHRTPQSL